MLSDEAKRRLGVITSVIVALRRSCGQDDETIRREATEAAAKDIAKSLEDSLEQAEYMAEFRSSIERALEQNPG